jgi:hypothetical protein
LSGEEVGSKQIAVGKLGEQDFFLQERESTLQGGKFLLQQRESVLLIRKLLLYRSKNKKGKPDYTDLAYCLLLTAYFY